MKRWISSSRMRTAVMLLLGVLLVFALSAACAETQGTTGDLTWTVNDGNELTIAGSGAMPDYTMADGAP